MAASCESVCCSLTLPRCAGAEEQERPDVHDAEVSDMEYLRARMGAKFAEDSDEEPSEPDKPLRGVRQGPRHAP